MPKGQNFTIDEITRAAVGTKPVRRQGKHISPALRAAIEEAWKADPSAIARDIATHFDVGLTTVQKIGRQLREQGLVTPVIPGQTRRSEPSTPERDRRIVGLEDQVRDLQARLKDAHRDHLNEDAVREVLGVMARAPEEPPEWLTRVKTKADAKQEVPVAIWSDWHYGEVVSRAETNGFNEFNPEIAERRIRRLLESTIDLCANHGPGKYPGIVINLLGDFVSGGLHPELAKTDAEDVIPASLRMRDLLVTLLTRAADVFGKVYVPCAAGNHGRATQKPEFKGYVYKNFDWLIYQLLVRHFDKDPRVRIDVRPANEVTYAVYGKRFLAMHGDMLGVKGGDGIIGAIGPIMRGEIKARGQATSLGADYDILLIGHWHQPLWLPRAIVNNALKGFDEYAKNALRAAPTEPSQMLFFVHPRRGITSKWEVKLEEPPAATKQWVAWTEAA
jgi:hypothetical protein